MVTFFAVLSWGEKFSNGVSKFSYGVLLCLLESKIILLKFKTNAIASFGCLDLDY